jgi:hypothetical protein
MWMTMMIWPVVSSQNKAGYRSIILVPFNLKYFYIYTTANNLISYIFIYSTHISYIAPNFSLITTSLILLNSHNPSHITRGERMSFPPAHELPSRRTKPIFSTSPLHQCLDLLRVSRPQAGDQSVEHQHKWDNRNHICEEQMTGTSPEVKGRDYHHEYAHSEHSDQR